MSITAITAFNVSSSPSAPAAPEPAAAGFAAVLAGAIAPPPASLPSPERKSATSELDGDSEFELGGTVKSDDGSDTTPASATNTALAALGAGAVGLNAALQSKLARVIERMHTEFGRDVRIVEGVRSQARQNQLFAQGRDTAGPVVTWTRNSLHTAGRAADLVINGGYDDAAGFALLRQVAEQEGLHTLGAKDPGHVELRGAATPADTANVRDVLKGLAQNDSAGKAAAPAKMVIAMAPVRVATVATVATVAAVARIASVARVGQSLATGASAETHSTGSTVKGDVAPAPIAAPAERNSGADSSGGGRSAGERQDGAKGGTSKAAHVQKRDDGADAYRALDGVHALSGGADATSADSVGDPGITSATRVSRAMDAQDAPGPRTLSRLTLSLDDGQGGHDHVNVGMHGASVGASFDMSSAASADRITARLGELTRSLTQRGLEPQAFQVRASSAAREPDVARGATVTTAQRAVNDAAAMRNDTQSGLGGDARQRFSQQDDQQERAQRRQDDQARRSASFSLNTSQS